MTLEVRLRHRLGDFQLDVAFEAGPGITALFGRSGSGKTSVVNAIGGLLRPDAGRVAVDGRVLLDSQAGVFVPRHRRRIGYVFQEARLFPHLSVRANLLYGRWFTSRAERTADFGRIVGLLGIDRLLDRRPARLSGGERQRVAIGRALMASPRLLLMDEPLASLDAERKEEILPYVQRLRDDAGLAIVYVSHAVPEVTRLADTLVLMSEGRVQAAGGVAEVMSRPDLFPLTGRYEAGAVLEGHVAGHDAHYRLTRLATPAGPFTVARLDLAVGQPVRIRVRARDVMLATVRPEAISALNVLPARIDRIGAVDAAAVDVRLDCNGVGLLARITRRSLESLALAPGSSVFAVIKTVAIDQRALGRSGSGRSEEHHI